MFTLYIKSKSKHSNLKRIQHFSAQFKKSIKLISNQFEVINGNDWLQQTCLKIFKGRICV